MLSEHAGVSVCVNVSVGYVSVSVLVGGLYVCMQDFVLFFFFC